jgi:hypothetical protein
MKCVLYDHAFVDDIRKKLDESSDESDAVEGSDMPTEGTEGKKAKKGKKTPQPVASGSTEGSVSSTGRRLRAEMPYGLRRSIPSRISSTANVDVAMRSVDGSSNSDSDSSTSSCECDSDSDYRETFESHHKGKEATKAHKSRGDDAGGMANSESSASSCGDDVATARLIS